MEILFALFMVFMIGVAIRGFIRTKDKKNLYRQKARTMTEAELKHEIYYLNVQVKHMPNMVRKNSADGVLLSQNKVKAKIIRNEMASRK
ncbi:MAG: hypothetical protein JWR38_1965 [Mucilaginibacter sp.]|nr:hypothetical protein [Mucilaginibacter sp.]